MQLRSAGRVAERRSVVLGLEDSWWCPEQHYLKVRQTSTMYAESQELKSKCLKCYQLDVTASSYFVRRSVVCLHLGCSTRGALIAVTLFGKGCERRAPTQEPRTL